MDDEDRGAFGFAAEALKTKSGFQGGEGSSSNVLGALELQRDESRAGPNGVNNAGLRRA